MRAYACEPKEWQLKMQTDFQMQGRKELLILFYQITKVFSEPISLSWIVVHLIHTVIKVLLSSIMLLRVYLCHERSPVCLQICSHDRLTDDNASFTPVEPTQLWYCVVSICFKIFWVGQIWFPRYLIVSSVIWPPEFDTFFGIWSDLSSVKMHRDLIRNSLPPLVLSSTNRLQNFNANCLRASMHVTCDVYVVNCPQHAVTI